MKYRNVVANAARTAAKAGLAAVGKSGATGATAVAGKTAAGIVNGFGPASVVSKLKELNGGEQAQPEQVQEPDYYEQQLAQLEEWRKSQMSSINDSTQAAINAINAGRSGIESDYADTMREAYISQQKNKLANSDYLNAMGYSGGMTESTLADIDNTYQNNRLAGYKVRQNALSELDKQVAEARNTGNTNLANLTDSYYDKYINILNAKKAYEEQKEQAAQEQANLDRQFDYDKQQDKLEQKNYQQENKEKRYQASLSGRYKTVTGAQNAIKSIKKSGKNTWKIPYIYERIGEIREEQAKAAKKKVSSGSGRSGSSISSKGSDGTPKISAIERAAKSYVDKHPGVKVNSATIDYYLAQSDYSTAQKQAFKSYMQKYGAGSAEYTR